MSRHMSRPDSNRLRWRHRQASTNNRRTHDAGSILPLVMVASFIIGTVVIALAGYVTADIRYGIVVEERADRLAAADGGLRYGVENLRNYTRGGALCTTGAGTGGGYTTIFPPTINGAQAAVTCRRVGQEISDVQGWGVVVTGEGVPNGIDIFTTKGAGGSNNVKTFSGPIYMTDPSRMDLQSRMRVENGDLWYTQSNCDTELVIPEVVNGTFEFRPDFFRGPLCTEKTWTQLFRAPTATLPPAALTVNPAPDTSNSGCTVWSPGHYTSLNLNGDNYFKAGEYYFDDIELELQSTSAIFGFPDTGGDAQKISAPNCNAAMLSDKAVTLAAGGQGGATIWLGGYSRFYVRNGGELEIFRRKQNETFISVYAIANDSGVYEASDLDHSDWLLETQSGNTNDVAIHGLVWAPKSAATLGNVTNAANGQLLGGIVVAKLDTQASSSAQAFAIGVESNPVDTKLLLISTATLNGRSTIVRAVVQFRPDTSELAVNSWRVRED
jgi:hypothetical protein